MESKRGNAEALVTTTLEPEVKVQFMEIARANHRSMRAELRVAVLNHIARKSA